MRHTTELVRMAIGLDICAKLAACPVPAAVVAVAATVVAFEVVGARTVTLSLWLKLLQWQYALSGAPLVLARHMTDQA